MTLRALSTHREPRFHGGTRDLRRWEVRDRRGDTRLGTVQDLLVDDDGHTRYLDVEVEGRGEHVLMPPGHVEASRQGNVLYTEGLSREALDRLPAYDGDPSHVDREQERRLHAAYDEAYGESGYFDRPEYRGRDWSAREGREPRGELAALTDLDDFKIASDEPDPRGWQVVDAGGQQLGTVRHLIGDPGVMRVRYLAIAPSEREAEHGERLVPAGYADLDRDRREVRVDALSPERLAVLPRWEPGRPVDVATARRSEESLSSGYRAETEHHHPRYRDEGVYGPYRGEETTPATAEGDPGLTVRRRHHRAAQTTGARR